MQYFSFIFGNSRINLQAHGQRIFFINSKQKQRTVYKDKYKESEEVHVSHRYILQFKETWFSVIIEKTRVISSRNHTNAT